MIFRTKYNFKASEEKGETIHGVSMTVPDMNLSVREMLEKYTTGTLPPIYMKGTYEEEPDIDGNYPLLQMDIDLTDADEEARQLYARDSERQKVIKSKQKLKEKELRERQARFEAWEKKQAEEAAQPPIEEEV